MKGRKIKSERIAKTCGAALAVSLLVTNVNYTVCEGGAAAPVGGGIQNTINTNQPAVLTPTPSTTPLLKKKPTLTPTPSVTATPTAAPAVTKTPALTPLPAAPEPTRAPTATEAPALTPVPAEPTEAPVVTEAPALTPVPGSDEMREPEPTQELEASGTPDFDNGMEPEVSETPVADGDTEPEVSETPNPDSDTEPEAAQTPEATETPNPDGDTEPEASTAPDSDDSASSETDVTPGIDSAGTPEGEASPDSGASEQSGSEGSDDTAQPELPDVSFVGSEELVGFTTFASAKSTETPAAAVSSVNVNPIIAGSSPLVGGEIAEGVYGGGSSAANSSGTPAASSAAASTPAETPISDWSTEMTESLSSDDEETVPSFGEPADTEEYDSAEPETSVSTGRFGVLTGDTTDIFSYMMMGFSSVIVAFLTFATMCARGRRRPEKDHPED